VLALTPVYTRVYPRKYAATSLPNTAMLVNQGNVAAPVIAVYSGDLSQSRLVDANGNVLNVAPLAVGEQIGIDTSVLAAWAEGGATRASYILAGSVPLLVPPRSSAAWTLYAAGGGSVSLNWRSAWQ
jgi:hypothetical protein